MKSETLNNLKISSPECDGSKRKRMIKQESKFEDDLKRVRYRFFLNETKSE